MGQRMKILIACLVTAAVTNCAWLFAPNVVDIYYKQFPKEYTETRIMALNVIGPQGLGRITMHNTGKVTVENVELPAAAMLFWQAAARNWPYLCLACKQMGMKELMYDKTSSEVTTCGWYQTES